MPPSPSPRDGEIPLAVCGAHMRGMALTSQMEACQARFVAQVRSAADYRFYALPLSPPRPGMVRVAPGTGGTVRMELWSIPPDGLGRLMAMIDAPLGIGTVFLEDGSKTKGFICETAGVAEARDITEIGCWRDYLALSA